MLLRNAAVAADASWPGDAVRARIDAVVASADGRVGIAGEILETGETFAHDGRGRYPMQSVYKFPIAMAVLAAVDAGDLALEQQVRVEPAEFISPRQHSPLRDRHPDGVTLPLEELLRLAVAESDGTASDVLLRVLGGAPRVMAFLRELGIDEIQVLDTEQAIGADDAVQYLNWATPRASVALLRALHEGRGISPQRRALLLRWMTETGTGRQRLKGLLPAGTIVAHKTGTSGTVDGVTAATNDVGLITLPDGRHLAVAVYVSEARGDSASRERVIAEIARTLWDAAVDR